MLPVRFVPYKWSKGDGSCLADVPNTRYFDAGAGIEVQYALDMLTMRKQKDEKENEKREQFRAASYIAFTLLTYVTLWELQRRVRAAHPETSMTMVRLAHTGKAANRRGRRQRPEHGRLRHQPGSGEGACPRRAPSSCKG